MNHTLEELAEAVHFGPRHDCAACAPTVARLEDELDLLRRADARLAPPKARAVRTSRLPLAAAAAVHLTIVALIVWRSAPPPVAPAQDSKKPPTVEELVKAFAGGKDDAGDRLRERGKDALFALLQARAKSKDSKRLHELIFEIKSKDADAGVVDKLTAIRMTCDFLNAAFPEMIDYLREISGLTIVIDAGLEGELPNGTIKLLDVPFHALLDAMLSQAGVDFDVRHGAVFISSPERLWKPPAPEPPPRELAEAEKKAARALVARFSSEALDEREKAAQELAKIGRPVIPVLEEGAKSADKEIAGRCRDLIARLTPRPVKYGLIPAAGAWRSQKLEGADKAIADKLNGTKMDLNFDSASLEDILGFVRDFTQLNVVLEDAPNDAVSLKVKDLTLGQTFELLTLQRGLDVKIKDGALVVFKREDK